MSCVHYQFKSSTDWNTLRFDGLNISVGELKSMIMERERIPATSYGLSLADAQTKAPFKNDGQLLPRNSSLIVARIPPV
jgi:E3 ubiquitin-protein ligase RBBP6